MLDSRPSGYIIKKISSTHLVQSYLKFLHGFRPHFSHLEVQVFLDDCQGHMVLHNKARKVSETNLYKQQKNVMKNFWAEFYTTAWTNFQRGNFN
jgi:hypothetical protein